MYTVVKSAGRVVYSVQISEEQYLSLANNVWVPTTSLLEMYKFPTKKEAESIAKDWNGSRVIYVTESYHIDGEYM